MAVTSPESPTPPPFVFGSPKPPKKRRTDLIIIGTAVGVLALVAVATVIAAAANSKPSRTTAAVATPVATPAEHAETTAPADSPSPTPTTASSPTPAWTPCPDLCPDSASDYNADSCTASQYSEQWGNNGMDGVVEAMIENKALVHPERLKDCPKYLPAWEKAQTGFDDGTYAVPGDIKPGTYETLSGVNNCYWERARGGETIDNRFIVGSATKIRVTIRSGDDTFISRDCGDWVKVG